MFNQVTKLTSSAYLPRVEELVRLAIQNFELGSYDIVYDCSKSLVECSCKTILNDLKIEFSNDDDFQKVVKKTLQSISLLPGTHLDEPALRDSILKTISGFVTIAQGIGELRNSQGIMAHGGDASYFSLGKSYALLMINLSDAIATFLFSRHEKLSSERKRLIKFEDNNDFNSSIDQQFGAIEIFEVSFEASDIFFALDPQGYEAYLNEFKNEELDEK